MKENVRKGHESYQAPGTAETLLRGQEREQSRVSEILTPGGTAWPAAGSCQRVSGFIRKRLQSQAQSEVPCTRSLLAQAPSLGEILVWCGFPRRGLNGRC